MMNDKISEVSWYQEYSAAVVHIPERLSTANVNDVEKQIKSLKADKKIILDMAACTLADSSALGMFVRHKDTVKICTLTPVVQSLFELTRLNEVLDIHKSLFDALSAIQDQ